MRRVISLFLPTWATDRVRRKSAGAPPRECPVVTVQEGNRRVVISVDEVARALKLHAGMTVAHAQALVPGLHIVTATPDEDEAALSRLGLWCTRYSPLVSPDPPDGIFIDIAGSAHLFKGEAALLQDFMSRLHTAELGAKGAVADTPGCAWAVARFGSGGIVPPAGAANALGGLPILALRLPAHTVESLRDVGIERIAQLATKPRASLQTRFGAELLLRLDQALGSAHEALTSLQLSEVPCATLKFAEPVGDPADLQRIIEKLCEILTRDLETRGIGARRLDLVFLRVDNVAQAVRIGTSRPNRDGKHLGKLLSERLVLVDPGFGIEQATLTASWVEALTERQTIGRHVSDGVADVDIGTLVDTLQTRLGPQRVFRVAPVESDIPERSVRRVAPISAPNGISWPNDLPRPARLLNPPEPVTAVAEIPDSPPRLFVWRKRQHRIVKADGPERILGEWWLAETEKGLQRDYYRVENAGGERFWLFRDAPADQGGRWWLHGLGEA